jgi:hypothetical protein
MNPKEEPESPGQRGEQPETFVLENRVNYDGTALPDVMKRWKLNLDRRNKPFYQYFVFCRQEEKGPLLEYIRQQLGIDRDAIKIVHVRHGFSVFQDLKDQANDITAIQRDTIMVIVEGYGEALQASGGLMAHGYNQVMSEYGATENAYQAAGKHLAIVTVVTAEGKGYETAQVDAASSQFKDGLLELQ